MFRRAAATTAGRREEHSRPSALYMPAPVVHILAPTVHKPAPVVHILVPTVHRPAPVERIRAFVVDIPGPAADKTAPAANNCMAIDNLD